jgi:site-specific recombinase XerD
MLFREHNTMDNPFTDFTETLAREGKSALTIKSYLSDLRHFAVWFTQTNGETFSPQGITLLDVRAYQAHMLTVSHFRPATINRRFAALPKYCRWAKGQGFLKDDPTSEVKGVRQVKAAPKALSSLELRRLLREAHKGGVARDIALIETLANTGLRVGELAALTLDDAEISERKGMVTVRAGKGAKYRQVPLNADARRAISAYLHMRPQSAETCLFLGQRDETLTPSAIWRVVRKYGQRAGLEISPHTLRHTFGTRLVRSGIDLVTVAAMMGHESLDTTALYTQPTREDMAEAVESLNAM